MTLGVEAYYLDMSVEGSGDFHLAIDRFGNGFGAEGYHHPYPWDPIDTSNYAILPPLETLLLVLEYVEGCP